jgi:hypothetical protein
VEGHSGIRLCLRWLSKGSNRARPRAQRLLMVPGAQPRICAASSTEYPSMSTSTSAARWSAFKAPKASATTLRCSLISYGSLINVVPILLHRSRSSGSGSVSGTS